LTKKQVKSAQQIDKIR